MIPNFYRLAENLHQLCIGDISIYYSYKIPVAYRIGKDLKISESIVKEHMDILSAGHKPLIMDKNNFNFNLRYYFKSSIYNLAENFTKERLGVSKLSNSGKSSNRSNGAFEKRCKNNRRSA